MAGDLDQLDQRIERMLDICQLMEKIIAILLNNLDTTVGQLTRTP